MVLRFSNVVIHVAYYNEARILNPVTFDTILTLPNMPGNVNNCKNFVFYFEMNPGADIFCLVLAGRTYPLEGMFQNLFITMQC